MAFFGIVKDARAAYPVMRGVSDAFLHKHECAVCPLNNQAGLRSPHMEPTGVARPQAYFLGGAPDGSDDRKGEQFASQAGRILRHHLPGKWLAKVRFNNCVRTRPPKDRPPARAEIEACRPSVEKDIEQSQPAAIVGFGNVPLSWAGVAESGIAMWSGRRTPALVAGLPRWYFPIISPSAVQDDPRWRGIQRQPGRYGSEGEFTLALHLRRALAAIEAGLPEPVVHSADDARDGVEWVDGSGGDSDVDHVAEFLARAATRKYAGLDYETKGLRPYAADAKILTAAVSTLQDGALAFPFDHREVRWSKRQRAAIDDLWGKFLYEAECRKVVHQLAFEMEWSAHYWGADCLRAGRWGDSISQAYVMDERPGGHSLEFLVQQYFGINIKKLAGVDRADLDAAPLPKVLQYNGVDAKYHRLLYAVQAAVLREMGMTALYAEHLERVPTAVLTQLKGIPVNQRAVLDLGMKYIPKMVEAEAAVRRMGAIKTFERGGQRFRPSANEDVKRVTNDVLGYQLDNVDEAALETVDPEFARRAVEWRKAAKVYGTYIMPVCGPETLAELEDERRSRVAEIGGAIDLKETADSSRIYPDGMLHPQTNVNRTRTTRTSSDGPNYQNWPKRGSAEAIEARRPIKPIKAGELIVSFDYGQIQARNVGMESLDAALIKSFWDDHDIHADFMEELARIYPRWVKEGVKALANDPKLQKKYRNDVKHGFVFASFFGAQAKKTAAVLGVPLWVGEALGDIFWDRFGGIRKWHGQLEVDYYKTGYVTGHAGYRRWAPVSYNERINSPIQADEAKIVLDAMMRLSKIDHDLLQASMEIHDDLTFVWPKSRVDELAPIVIKEMLTMPFEWARVTPIVVEMAVGVDWANLKEPDEHIFASNKYDGLDMPRRSPL